MALTVCNRSVSSTSAASHTSICSFSHICSLFHSCDNQPHSQHTCDSTQSVLTPGEMSRGKWVMTVWRYNTQSEACESTIHTTRWRHVGSTAVMSAYQVKKTSWAVSSDHLGKRTEGRLVNKAIKSEQRA